MPLSPEHLARRRPLWAALSDLFLDTETRWFVPRVALACARSSYDDATLESVFWAEVFPLAIHNLHDIAGEWALLELPERDLLARAEAAERDATLESRSAWMVDAKWRTALALCRHLRRIEAALWPPVVGLWETCARRFFEDLGRELLIDPTASLRDARAASLDADAHWQLLRPWLESMACADERRSLAARVAAVERMLAP